MLSLFDIHYFIHMSNVHENFEFNYENYQLILGHIGTQATYSFSQQNQQYNISSHRMLDYFSIKYKSIYQLGWLAYLLLGKAWTINWYDGSLPFFLLLPFCNALSKFGAVCV